MKALPRIALTMGDVAGIGPEVMVRALDNRDVQASCSPLVIGHPEILCRTIQQLNVNLQVQELQSVDQLTECTVAEQEVLCWNPPQENSPYGTDDVLGVPLGDVNAIAGWHACHYLQAAAHLALTEKIDGIVTAPLHKKAMNLAGINYPGHTEILADICNVQDYAMMLYLPAGERIQSAGGLGVAHVTLHTSVASVPQLLTTAGITEKAMLLSKFLQAIGIASPQIGVCALNPHAGEEGLFGDEETDIIQPAILQVAERGIAVSGPFPADTLFLRAVTGHYDGVVAMYHDQGHIPFKLLGFHEAVNITLGLPIVRTSPSHGTAYDIAGQNIANAEGILAAIRIATQLVNQRSQQNSL